jgi:hypothetical protein
LRALYAVDVVGADFLLLMRHRAVLLGLLGLLLVGAAFRPQLHRVAIVGGIASMMGLLLLALPLAVHNEAIVEIFWADTRATILLVGGAALLSGKYSGPIES